MTDLERAKEIAGKLSAPMRGMLLRARTTDYHTPPRCFGPSNTIAGLRNRGLAHGDFGYLTPDGLAVRRILEDQAC